MSLKNCSRNEQISELENKINYTFNKKFLLERAMTHSSYANQNKLDYAYHNERLEFLGDSVLSLTISEYLYKKYHSKPEGKLTRLRSSIVCEASLYDKAKLLKLGTYLQMGKGEEQSGGRERVSTLSDAFEALIGAIYLDGGLDNARQFIISQFSNMIETLEKKEKFSDYKTQLQELAQKQSGAVISYDIYKEEGPDHDKLFSARVYINDKLSGEGTGKSKKEAEQHAAKKALEITGDLK